MKYTYGIQDVFLAGSNFYVLHEGHNVYYSDDIEDLLTCAKLAKRDRDCFGILLGKDSNMFSIKVKNGDGSESIVKSPAIIYSNEDTYDEYVPFDNKEEFIRNYLDHVPFNDGLMSELCGEYLLRLSESGHDLIAVLAIKDSGLCFIDDMDVSWEDLMDNYYFLDKSVCGKLV